MPDNDKSAVDQRLENGIYGTPKIKPDEQRKYLGTFRERVCLTISVAELQQRNWTVAVTKELQRGIGNLVFINGNLPHSELHPYIQAATAANGQFTMKTDPEYKTDPESMAIVIAAKEAVYQSPVDVIKRYPNLLADSDAQHTIKKPAHHSWLHKLFSRKGD